MAAIAPAVGAAMVGTGGQLAGGAMNQGFQTKENNRVQEGAKNQAGEIDKALEKLFTPNPEVLKRREDIDNALAGMGQSTITQGSTINQQSGINTVSGVNTSSGINQQSGINTASNFKTGSDISTDVNQSGLRANASKTLGSAMDSLSASFMMNNAGGGSSGVMSQMQGMLASDVMSNLARDINADQWSREQFRANEILQRDQFKASDQWNRELAKNQDMWNRESAYAQDIFNREALKTNDQWNRESAYATDSWNREAAYNQEVMQRELARAQDQFNRDNLTIGTQTGMYNSVQQEDLAKLLAYLSAKQQPVYQQAATPARGRK